MTLKLPMVWVSMGIFHIQAEYRGLGYPWIPFLNTNRSNPFLGKSETDRSIACSALIDSGTSRPFHLKTIVCPRPKFSVYVCKTLVNRRPGEICYFVISKSENQKYT